MGNYRSKFRGLGCPEIDVNALKKKRANEKTTANCPFYLKAEGNFRAAEKCRNSHTKIHCTELLISLEAETQNLQKMKCMQVLRHKVVFG